MHTKMEKSEIDTDRCPILLPCDPRFIFCSLLFYTISNFTPYLAMKDDEVRMKTLLEHDVKIKIIALFVCISGRMIYLTLTMVFNTSLYSFYVFDKQFP